MEGRQTGRWREPWNSTHRFISELDESAVGDMPRLGVDPPSGPSISLVSSMSLPARSQSSSRGFARD
eukprot:765155-Hanusia_phi.AAC.2